MAIIINYKFLTPDIQLPLFLTNVKSSSFHLLTTHTIHYKHNTFILIIQWKTIPKISIFLYFISCELKNTRLIQKPNQYGCSWAAMHRIVSPFYILDLPAEFFCNGMAIFQIKTVGKYPGPQHFPDHQEVSGTPNLSPTNRK